MSNQKSSCLIDINFPRLNDSNSVSLAYMSIAELVDAAATEIRRYKNHSSIFVSLEAIKNTIDGMKLEEDAYKMFLIGLIYYWQNCIKTVDFVQTISNHWPPSSLLDVAEDLTALLECKTPGVKLLSCISHYKTRTASFAILCLGHSAEILPLSVEARGTTCTINTTAQLHDTMALPDAHERLVGINPLWAPCVMQLLQLEIDNADHGDAYRKQCRRYLRKMLKKFDVLPPSLYLKGIIKEGLHPIRGGGFSDIWKGQYNGQVVCLKVLRMFTESDDQKRMKLVSNFCHEALTWRQLDHPNVLKFLGVDIKSFEPGFCLVSPWMNNGDIVSFLKRHPDHDKLSSILQVASGLEYLHSLHPPIAHGDIRGANILVTEDYRCCLADFGLALVVETQTLVTTSTGGLKGSLRWLAPEFLDPISFPLANKADMLPRDIYAFGCTVIEIYSGNVPFFEEKVEIACTFRITRGRRPSRPKQCEDDVWALVQKCWDQDSRLRPCVRDICVTLGSIIECSGRSTSLDTLTSATHSPLSSSRSESPSSESTAENAIHKARIAYRPDSDYEDSSSSIMLSDDESAQFPLTISSHLTKSFPRRYFILKSLSQDDLDVSVQSGLWATQKHNEGKLDLAYRTSKEVYLIFSANQSGKFYGYAKMSGPIKQPKPLFAWKTKTDSPTYSPYPRSPDVSTPRRARSNLNKVAEAGAAGRVDRKGQPFKVEWIRVDLLPFYRTRHLRNPWNENKEVKISRDGTELEPAVGQKLIGEWDNLPSSLPSLPDASQSVTNSDFANSYYPLTPQLLE